MGCFNQYLNTTVVFQINVGVIHPLFIVQVEFQEQEGQEEKGQEEGQEQEEEERLGQAVGGKQARGPPK